jgi:hypothetical protein
VNAQSPVDNYIILGGGLADDGPPQPWVQNRIDYAIESYRADKRADKDRKRVRFIFSSGGTTHIGLPTDMVAPNESGHRCFPTFESAAGGKYLLDALEGEVDSSQVLIETNSYDTIGNALFCLQLFVMPLELKNILVVTSNFHLPRSEAVFKHVFGLGGIELSFQGVVNIVPPGADYAKALADRIDDELSKIPKFQETYGGLTDLASFTQTFYSNFGLYTGEQHNILRLKTWAEKRTTTANGS